MNNMMKGIGQVFINIEWNNINIHEVNNMMKGIGQVVLNRKTSTNLLQYSCSSSNKFSFVTFNFHEIRGLVLQFSSYNPWTTLRL